MSAEDLENFFEQVSKDEDLKSEFDGLEDQEAIVEKALQLGEEQGYEFTEEEVHRVIQQTMDESGELSEEQLEQVSGGFTGQLIGEAARFVGDLLSRI